LITHDFGVVAQMADDVAVMRNGAIVERGPVRAVIEDAPACVYPTLLDSLPSRRAAVARLGLAEGEGPPGLCGSEFEQSESRKAS
jgi:ABC-type dipeptide/oligopeptide/nickel transport system ATPase component